MLMAAEMQQWLEGATFAGSAARLQRPEPQWLHGQGMPPPVRFHGNGPGGNRVLGFAIARGKLKELPGMEDLLRRCWHGNDRKP